MMLHASKSSSIDFGEMGRDGERRMSVRQVVERDAPAVTRVIVDVLVGEVVPRRGDDRGFRRRLSAAIRLRVWRRAGHLAVGDLATVFRRDEDRARQLGAGQE